MVVFMSGWRTGSALLARAPSRGRLRSFLSHDDEDQETPSHVQFISLNHRSLVGGRTPSGQWSDDFLNRLIHRLLGGEHATQTWSPCLKCDAWNRCTAGPNAHRLLAPPIHRKDSLGNGCALAKRRAPGSPPKGTNPHHHPRTTWCARLRAVWSHVAAWICTTIPVSKSDRYGTCFLLQSHRSDRVSSFENLRLLILHWRPIPNLTVGSWGALHAKFRGLALATLAFGATRRAVARYIEWSEQEIEALTGDSTSLPLANGDHLRLFKEASLRSADRKRRNVRSPLSRNLTTGKPAAARPGSRRYCTPSHNAAHANSRPTSGSRNRSAGSTSKPNGRVFMASLYRYCLAA